MKNPFAFLFESKIYPHARTLRTSLGQKFLDSFNVFYGDTASEVEATIGLFDIFTLGIPASLDRLTVYLSQRLDELLIEEELHPTSDWDIALVKAVKTLNFIFNQMPRFLFSTFFALVAFLPITLPIHLIARTVDYFSDDSLSEALTVKNEFGGTLQQALLASDESTELYDIEELKAEIRQTPSQTKEIYLYIPSEQGKREHNILLSRSLYDKTSYAIKALFTHNIGNIASLYPKEALETLEPASSNLKI
ncbi:MAG: hypothetical protein H0T84_14085 [Tatlockia sp.]|nr:hypothetical protein [Tatlockia sp.]